MTSVLVSVPDLAAELATATPPLVLDARYNLTGIDGRTEFLAGHVPGARYVDLDTELAGPAGAQGRHPLPDPAVFVAGMRRVGLTDAPVVVTDGGSTLGAARLWWLLRDAGHADVRVLDGGFTAWTAAGRPVETGADVAVAPSEWEASPGQGRRTDADGVVAALRAGGDVVDVRAPERYAGQTEPIDPVAGHIPGARNVPSAGLFDEGLFRPADELAQVLDGFTAETVVYCGSGVTACQVLLAAAVAGRPVGVLYPGSWSEWIADPQRPVAVGPTP